LKFKVHWAYHLNLHLFTKAPKSDSISTTNFSRTWLQNHKKRAWFFKFNLHKAWLCWFRLLFEILVLDIVLSLVNYQCFRKRWSIRNLSNLDWLTSLPIPDNQLTSWYCSIILCWLTIIKFSIPVEINRQQSRSVWWEL
jgi:hypothetical protein